MKFGAATMSFCFPREVADLVRPLGDLVGTEFEVPWGGGHDHAPARIVHVEDKDGELWVTMEIHAPVDPPVSYVSLDLSRVSLAQ
jgi:hypothetical protein